MTPSELQDLATQAIAGGRDHLILVTERKSEPKGQRVRLAPGLMARYVSWERGSRYVVEVRCLDVLRWCRRLRERAREGGAA